MTITGRVQQSSVSAATFVGIDDRGDGIAGVFTLDYPSGVLILGHAHERNIVPLADVLDLLSCTESGRKFLRKYVEKMSPHDLTEPQVQASPQGDTTDELD